MRTIYLILFTLVLFSCRDSGKPAAEVDPLSLPAMEGDTINVVVEIPAGTNRKIEFNAARGEFLPDSLEGRERVINFLPYPGNYGFIPSTQMDQARGGDGDAMDVLVIGESMPTGSHIRALPIGALKLLDQGEADTKIIAVPVDPDKQVITTASYQDFYIDYHAARRIVEDWFLNYKGFGVMELQGWEDEAWAREEIRKWEDRSRNK